MRVLRTGENTCIGRKQAKWQAELKLHTELFTQLKHHLPKELEATRLRLEQRLAA
jgi:phosphoenolpyruvate carboxykinase (GTP)